MNKYKNCIACSYGHKLVCVDDKFSKSFKSWLGEDAVLLIVWLKKVSTAVKWWKKHFNKEKRK